MVEKFDLKSKSITEEQKVKLKQIFPEVFTEGDEVDFDKLKITLGEDIDTGEERFGMNWPGKRDCFKVIQEPSIATLKPCKEESVNWDSTENLFIEGDNLEVLKQLQKSYYGKVKMIYIDPPYNTGNEFIYPDKFSESLETYLAYTGQVDSEGYKFSTNVETEGRFHTNWIKMMYPRLFLARNLLSDDGIIFVSIDDNEVYNLRLIINEVFGEVNFIGEIVWKKTYGGGSKAKYVVGLHEYVLCYAKSIEKIPYIDLPPDPKARKYYTGKDEKIHLRGPFRTQPLATTSMDGRPNLKFPIFWENEEIWPDKQWQWSKDRVEDALKNNELIISKTSDKWSVRYKQYLKDENGKERTAKLFSVLEGPYTQVGTSEIKNLFGDGKIFPFPKPSELLKHLISVCWEDKDCIILDFFSGSCVLADAVLNLNKEDNRGRRFICVQLPENCDENSESFKAGYKTISEIGKERIRRVIKKIEQEKSEENAKKEAENNLLDQLEEKPLDLGFRVFKLDKSNFKIWDGSVEGDAPIEEQIEMAIDHIDPKSSEEDILYEILLKSGFELTTPIKELTLEGKKIYSIADGALLICLEKTLTKELIRAIAEKEPSRVVCLDSGFSDNDQLKTNAVQIMKSHNVESFRTV